MITKHRDTTTATQGHVALYARDGRWRRAMCDGLGEAGHSYQQAADVAEMRRVLLSQRFDLLALNVRDEPEARDVAAALADVPLPPHGILVGNASALSLAVDGRRGGTFRYVPGHLSARELSRLVEASISSGTWDDGLAGSGSGALTDEVDLEEAIERAAAAVYTQAKRRRLRFSTVVESADARAHADPVKLQRALITLLRLLVSLAPRSALVSVEARPGADEWTVRLGVSSRGPALHAEALRDETGTLADVSRDLQQQGGLLWVELLNPLSLALCLTLPFAPDAERDGWDHGHEGGDGAGSA